ncbi:hypothetical protein GCM10009092_20560 [Bowmanella denitrificans]|uniref:Uncharacterized protein n=1 Tax=Bowmanella denitrificans TaxID=366582 RepID=A0ABN0X693_9ALTE|nr:hypothetical protein [Bowmanella denitrificans]
MKNFNRILTCGLVLLSSQAVNANTLDKDWLAELIQAQVKAAADSLELPQIKPVIILTEDSLTLDSKDNNAELLVKADSRQDLQTKAD